MIAAPNNHFLRYSRKTEGIYLKDCPPICCCPSVISSPSAPSDVGIRIFQCGNQGFDRAMVPNFSQGRTRVELDIFFIVLHGVDQRLDRSRVSSFSQRSGCARTGGHGCVLILEYAGQATHVVVLRASSPHKSEHASANQQPLRKPQPSLLESWRSLLSGFLIHNGAP